MAKLNHILHAGKKLLISLVGLAVLLSVLRLFSFYAFNDDDKGYDANFHANYKIYAVRTPEKLDFCGEEVPLKDQNVRERLDKELLSNTYFQSNTLLYFKRSRRWFPIIEPILKEFGIPNDFKYLPLVESNLTNVISPAGATGYWQLMKATAKANGLEVNEQVDERYAMRQSTRAACKYLKRAYRELGSWTLAAAAYNMGIDGIKRQLKKQKTDNYYDLYLNTETSRYLFRLLAIRDIVSQPNKYGYYIREKDLYKNVPIHIVEVDTSVSNLATFAKSLNINYRILKLHNPWLRRNNLPNKAGKKYQLIIPDSGYYVFTQINLDSNVVKRDSVNAELNADSIAPVDSAQQK